MTPCIHATDTAPLCPECLADATEDPLAWEEYGNHTAGLERWRELQREMDEAK